MCILWDFFEDKKTKFIIPILFDLAFCRLTGRSTEPEVSRPLWSTDVHRRAQLVPVDRAVD